MAEELPPLVTKLKGDLSDLAKTIAEAEAIVDKFNDTVSKKVETSAKETGEKAGKELSDGLAKAVEDGAREVEQAAKETGEKAGRGLTDKLGEEIVRGSETNLVRDIDHAAQNIADAFGNALSRRDGSLGDRVLAGFGRFLVASSVTWGKVAGGGFLNSFGKAFSESSLSSVLNKAGGLIPNFGHDGAKMAEAFKGGFLKGIGSLYTELPEVMAPVTAFVGAAIGGAILSVVGAGALATGIAAQFKDPSVHAAAADLGHFVSTEFKDASSSLVDPLVAGLRHLKTDLSPVFADLKKDFQALAPYVENFAMYLGIAAQKFMPGFSSALRAAGPVLNVIARDLPLLAGDISYFFDQISKGSKGGAEAIDVLIRAVGGLIEVLGFAIRYLSDGFDLFLAGWEKFSALLAKIPGLGPIFGPLHDGLVKVRSAFDDAAQGSTNLDHSTDALTRSVEAQKRALDGALASWDKWFGLSMSVDQANLGLHQAVDALTQAIAQNGRTWDINTKKGQDNRSALLQAIQAAHDYYDAQVKQYGDNPKFAAEYQKTIDKLLGQASAAGLAAGDVQQLRSEYGNLMDTLNSLNGKVYHYQVWAQQVGEGQVLGHGLRWGGVESYAAGGIKSFASAGIYSPMGGRSLVKFAEPETGGEAYIPRNGDPNRNLRTLATAASWMGAAVVPAMASAGGRGATLPPLMVELHARLEIDGREVHARLIPVAQQYKARTGTTGLA